MHVQNSISSSYNQASCVRKLETASVLVSLQWPHSKVWISRSITPQSEQRARKHCHTHAGVQAARRSDCDKCRTVGGRMVFQGVLNSKTVWATGSLFTWKGAQKTKHSKIYRRHHTGPPTRIVCVLVRIRRTNWPATCSEEQQACTDGVICMCSGWYYRTQSSKWSLTAAPCGPGGPGIPAWPGAPCRTDKTEALTENLDRFETHQHHHGWLPLTFIPGIPGVPSFPSIPGRPWQEKEVNEGRRWLHLACFPDHQLCVCVRSRSLPFCQLLPVGPGYLCYPAEETHSQVICNAMQYIRATVSIADLRNISSAPLLLPINVKWKTPGDSYLVSLVSWISQWSLRPLFTLQTKQKSLGYLWYVAGICFSE